MDFMGKTGDLLFHSNSAITYGTSALSQCQALFPHALLHFENCLAVESCLKFRLKMPLSPIKERQFQKCSIICKLKKSKLQMREAGHYRGSILGKILRPNDRNEIKIFDVEEICPHQADGGSAGGD